MAKIQQLLQNKTDKIDYKKIIADNPWIIKENMKCILSPDSDGFLCGLLLSHLKNWEIVGFYDGKVLLLKDGISCYDEDVCFLDIEVCRIGIKSIGHHMLLYNSRYKPEYWNNNFKECIQPNLMRNFDGVKTFRLKYPLATIHLILGILNFESKLEIPESAICPLLFTDGTYNVLFGYPENVLNWLEYLDIFEKENILTYLFTNEKYSVFRLMKAMDDFFKIRNTISAPKERGDRLKISNKNASPYNIEKDEKNNLHFINKDAVKRIKKFIQLNSDLIGWNYKVENWNFDNFNLFQFTKEDFQAKKTSITNKTFDDFIKLNPLSWAMTSGQNIEYTLEYPDKMP